MIPAIARIGVNRNGRDSIYWIPLILLWLLLVPVALLAAIPVVIICLVHRLDPIDVACVAWGVLASLRGTEADLVFANYSLSISLL